MKRLALLLAMCMASGCRPAKDPARAYLVYGHDSWPPDTVVADKCEVYEGGYAQPRTPEFWWRGDLVQMYVTTRVDSVVTLCGRRRVWAFNWSRFDEQGHYNWRAIVDRDAACADGRPQ